MPQNSAKLQFFLPCAPHLEKAIRYLVTHFPKISSQLMRNIAREMMSGTFQFANLCTGMSSISRAALSEPMSTGEKPAFRTRLTT